MAPDNEEIGPEIRDVPAEARADTGVAQAARDGQEKPQELEDKEAAHERLRRKYKTASSGPLPRIDFLEEDPSATKQGAGEVQQGADFASKTDASEVKDTVPKTGEGEGADFARQTDASEDSEVKPGVTKKEGADTSAKEGEGPAPAPASKTDASQDGEVKRGVTKKEGTGEGADTGTKVGAGEGRDEDFASKTDASEVKATAAKQGAGEGAQDASTQGFEQSTTQTGLLDAAPEEKARALDPILLEKAAEGIHAACDGLGTNTDAIYAILKDKTEAERKQIDEIYAQKYGIHLEEEFKDEMSGAQLDQAINLLNRKDGSTDEAGRIHAALIERHQLIEGRSDETCERDIRDTLSTLNSKQIEALDRDYKERYGKSLEEALVSEGGLSDGTKEAIKIYLKGADKRTDEDTLKLADLALHSQNVDMVQEAFRNASPEARQKFFAEGGEDKIMLAFLMDPEAHAHAMEYARSGELSVTTLVNENQSWLGDNEAAIEKALSGLNASQREDYLRGKELAAHGSDSSSLPGQDQRALQFYTELHDSLVDAGNDAEVARWEDMVAHKGGTLVSKLMEHRGTIYDDSAGDVIKTIEGMSKDDWARLKGPEGASYRKEVEDSLKTYLGDDDVRRCMEIIDKKSAAETFDEASVSGRRSNLAALDDSAGVFNDKEDQVYDAISKMTPAELEQYRSDERFRKAVDDKVAHILDEGPELDAGRAMLDKVLKGEAPTEDIVAKLNRHAADINTDEAAVIREVVKEFGDHPELREKIVNPQTAEQKEYAERFMKALHAALDETDVQRAANPLNNFYHRADDFEKYAKPLLETGRLPLDLQMELNKGIIDDDEQGFYKDLVALAERKDEASRAERQRILTDGAYQERVLGALSADERKVAIYALEQGEMRPEDKIRSHVVGVGTGEEEIKEVLRGLTPAEREQLKSDYARKYGEDLTFNLLDEMGGQDAVDAKRAIRREYEDSRSAFNDARDEYYQSRDGFGSAFVDQRWDGTGFQADQAYNTFSRAMTEHAAKFEELPVEQRRQLMSNLQESVDMFKESKGALADGLTDAGVTVGCIAAGFVTEGGTWALLGALVVGGFFKVGAKGAIMGADYDWKSSAVVADFASGGTDAALNMVTFGAGSSAASAVLKQGGKELIKEGAEQTLERGLVGIVRESIADGSYKYSDQAVKELVGKLAKEGADKEALETIVRQNLDKAVKEESESTIKKLAKEYLLNVETGVVGGAGSGTVRAAAQWDSEKSFGENMAAVGKAAATSAAFGAAGAVAATSVFKVGGEAFHAVQGHYKLRQGEKLGAEQLDEVAKATGGKDATAHYNENGDIEVTQWVERPAAKADDVAPEPAGQRDLARTVDERSPMISPEKPTVPDRPDPAWAEQGVYKLDDGREIEMVERGGFYFKRLIGSAPPEGLALKVHVLTSDTADLEQLQSILMKELQDNKELSDLAANWKTINPGDPPVSGAIGDGQNAKAFTLSARSPEEAVQLAEKLDEILAKHPEFKPIDPEGLDTMVGKSGRVGVVRDQYTPSVDANGNHGAMLDKNLAERIAGDPALERDANGRLADKSLRDLETRTGMKSGTLTYDAEGNLMLRAPDRKVEVLDGIKSKVGEPKDGDRFSEEQLRAFEGSRFPEGTFYYNEAGELMQKAPPPRDGKLYLTESNVGRVARGEVDPETGKVSDGLESRFAYYKLAEAYGTSPVDSIVFRAGETVKWSGENVTVLGRDAESVVVRPVDAAPPDGPVVEVSDQKLAREYTRLGDSDYYLNPDGFYLLRTSSDGSKSLIKDLDATSVEPERLVKGSDSAGVRSPASAGPNAVDIAEEPTIVGRRPVPDQSPHAITGEATVVDGDPVLDVTGEAVAGDPALAEQPREVIGADIHDQPTRIDGQPLGREMIGTDIHDQPTHIEGEPLGREVIGADIHDQPTHIEGQPLTSTSEEVVSDTPASPGRTPSASDGTPPRAVAVPEDTPAIVREFLERAGTPEQERGALLARIAENDLAKPEALEGFRQRAVEMTSKWDDISQVGRNAEASRKELEGAFARYREALMANAPEGARPESMLGMHPNEARNLLRDDPYALRALDEYLRVRDANAKIQKEYYDALKPRVKEMQDLLDDVAEKHGLPKVKVEPGDKVEMGGANGFFRDGKLVLRESDFLGNQDPVTFMESAYHEFVHNGQESLVLRSLVDHEEAAIDRPLRAEDMDRLKELNRKLQETGKLSAAEHQERSVIGMAVEDIRKAYREQAGSGFSNDHLREILDARDGKLLTNDERVRAGELAKAWKETGPAGDAYEKALDDLKVTTSELKKVSQPGGEYMLIERLANDNGTLSRHLFGADAPPRDVAALVDIYKRLAAGAELDWPSWNARSVLRGVLQQREGSLVELKTQLYQKYLSGFHEQEAWVIGSTLRADAIEAGVSGRPAIAQSPGDVLPVKPTQEGLSRMSDGVSPDSKRILSIDDRVPTGHESSLDGPSEKASMSGPGELRTVEQPKQGELLALDDPNLRVTGRENLGQAELDKLSKMSGDHALADQFPPPTSAELADMRKSLEAELRAEVPVVGTDGVPTNMMDKLDKLVETEKLGAGQRARILNVLAEVRTALKRIDDGIPEGSPAKGYQDVNWKHTRAEIDQVIDASLKLNLDSHEMENAIIASIFSDSSKFPKTPDNPGNFLVHNIDGAKAAAEVLPRYFDMSAPHNMGRLDHISNAIREHQIGPPEFMANIIRNSLRGVLGKGITDAEKDTVQSIWDKVSKPMTAPHVTDGDGVRKIVFSDAERELLGKVGVKDWYVPNPDSAWYGASRAVIDGDSLINYASPDGWGKIAAIRGPDTAPWFEDPTVFDSLASAKGSYDDASTVLSDPARPLAEAGLARTTRAVEKVKSDIERWFKQLEAEAVATGVDPATVVPRNPDGTIAFWDAPLKYPSKGELTPLEKEQFTFAKKIREEMVRRLREMQGVFDKPPVTTGG